MELEFAENNLGGTVVNTVHHTDKALAEICMLPDISNHRLTPNEDCQNIIETIDLCSPSPVKTNEDLDALFDLHDCEIIFQDSGPINYTRPLPPSFEIISGHLQSPSLPTAYNLPCIASLPKYDDCVKKGTKKDILPFSPKHLPRTLVTLEVKPVPVKIETFKDEDIIFVKEWNLLEQVKEAQTVEIQSSEITSNGMKNIDKNTEKNTSPAKREKNVQAVESFTESSTPTSAIIRRKRKPKENTISKNVNLRQSCRTTGAILCPPSALTRQDHKVWPQDGMHERPFYDVTTNTITKYHFPNSISNKTDKNAAGSSTAANISAVLDQQNSDSHSNYKSSEDLSDSFKQLALRRLKLMFSYFKEVKELNKLISGTAKQKKDREKLGTCKNSPEFSKSRHGIRKTKLKTQFVQIKTRCNIKKVHTMLCDTCILYNLADKVTFKTVSAVVNSDKNVLN